MFIYIYISHISIHVFIYITYISSSLYIYDIFLYHYSLLRGDIPPDRPHPRSRPRRRPTLRRPGPHRSRPKAPGRRRRGDITGEEV